MEKEKKIEELAEAIYKSGVAIEGTDIAFGLYDTDTHFHRMAAKLYDAGYGNVKEAVKEFAEKLKKKFIRLEKKYGDEADRDKNTIPNLQFEFYKPVVEREVAFANGQATMANKAQDFIDELIKEVCGG